MTSSAIMRLVGLLVIVGMVAGCGAEPTAPEAADESPVAALTMDDVVALQHEQALWWGAIREFRDARQADSSFHSHYVAALIAENKATLSVTRVGQYSEMMENAVRRGDDRAARIWRDKALAELDAAREQYVQAREECPSYFRLVSPSGER